jgi:hypothetical protein
MRGLSTIGHRDSNSQRSAEPIECFSVYKKLLISAGVVSKCNGRMVGGLFKNISEKQK